MTDLFTPTADQPSEENIREELLNKWKDKPVEELLKAKVESDLYIKSLERQKDELRSDWMKAQEDIQTRENLQALIDRLNNEKAPLADTIKPEEKPDILDPKKIEELVHRKIEDAKRIDHETSNFNKVQARLAERFGSNTGSILQEQANSLGLSKDDVNSLAKKSPEAFFRIMGLDQPQQETFMSPPRSNVRNDHFAPKTEKRTWNYYQDMKAKDPKKYWAPATQLQMHRDSDTLGAAFEDGDFNN